MGCGKGLSPAGRPGGKYWTAGKAKRAIHELDPNGVAVGGRSEYAVGNVLARDLAVLVVDRTVRRLPVLVFLVQFLLSRPRPDRGRSTCDRPLDFTSHVYRILMVVKHLVRSRQAALPSSFTSKEKVIQVASLMNTPDATPPATPGSSPVLFMNCEPSLAPHVAAVGVHRRGALQQIAGHGNVRMGIGTGPAGEAFWAERRESWPS